MRPATAFVVACVSCVAIAMPASSRAQTLVVLNKSDHNASVIDVATGKTLAKLSVGRGPHELAVTPDGQFAYVANFGRFGVFPAGDTTHTLAGNSFTQLDLARRVRSGTWTLEDYAGMHGVATSGDGKRVWMTADTPNAVLELDAYDGRILHAWPTNQQRTHLVLATPDEKKLYATNTVTGSVSVIDRASGTVKNIPVGAGAEGIAISPDGREVWVARRADSKISVIPTARDEIAETFDAGGEGPQRLRFSPDGSQVWTSNVRSNTLSVFDAKTRALLGTVSVAAGPAGIVFSPDGKRAYFALSGANQIAVIDVAGRKVLSTIATGLEPDGIAYVPR